MTNDHELLRMSQRIRRYAIPNDYVTYMSENVDESMSDDDPILF